MLKSALSLLAVTAVAWALSPEVHKATAMPKTDLRITMTIWPMQGIHSDWHRRVTISHNGERISKDLFGDTGWWRGSNLYRHASGAYVVHEGQGGCFGFSLDPLAFRTGFDDACIKGDVTTGPLNGYSLYHPDLIYIGHFFETWRDENGVRLRYSVAAQTPEIALPDPL